ncbi:MAG TPA: HAD-IA family hydrolase [Candidatus Deferrimicrobiaceae bacterium]|jgi:phosphoglycolate phosphatase
MEKRLLVFDLDGTLVDSREDLAVSVNYTMAQHGLPALPYEKILSYVGDGVTMLLRRAIGPGHEEMFPAIRRTFLAHYREHLLDHTLPYPGVLESLLAHGDRYRTAVLTNKPIGMTHAILDGLFPPGTFREIRGGDSFATKKPDPEGLIDIMASEHVSTAETLMVGDSSNDVRAGAAAGVATCGVTYGLGCHGFAEYPPDFTVDHFPDLFGRIRPAG